LPPKEHTDAWFWNAIDLCKGEEFAVFGQNGLWDVQPGILVERGEPEQFRPNRFWCMLFRAMDAQDIALPTSSPDVKRCIMLMLKQGKAWLWQRVLLERFVREAPEPVQLCAMT
jgi:hypothetical protein